MRLRGDGRRRRFWAPARVNAEKTGNRLMRSSRPVPCLYRFAGNDRAAQRSATFYTWVETCRLHGVDAPTWLADVCPRIATTRPSDDADLLPQWWARLRQTRVAA